MGHRGHWGLVDVPMARHSDFNESFISEYIFGSEIRAENARRMGQYVENQQCVSTSRGSERYLEIPGYPLGRQDSKNKQYSGKNV